MVKMEEVERARLRLESGALSCDTFATDWEGAIQSSKQDVANPLKTCENISICL